MNGPKLFHVCHEKLKPTLVGLGKPAELHNYKAIAVGTSHVMGLALLILGSSSVSGAVLSSGTPGLVCPQGKQGTSTSPLAPSSF